MIKLNFFVLLIVSLSFANDYEEWMKTQNAQFNTYKKTMDEEFTSMLKKDWKEFKSSTTQSPYKKAKPVVIPKIIRPIKVTKSEIQKSPVIQIKSPQKLILPKPKKVQLPTKKIKNFNMAKFTFYSLKSNVQYDKKTYFMMNAIDKNSISKFWEMMSNTNYKKLLSQINKTTQLLNLNDWAKYQYIHTLGNSIFKGNKNKVNLFTWFILVKMNYDVKVGYNNNSIYLMSTIEHSLFQVSFFTLKKKKYYILTPNGKSTNVGNIYTYKGEYPKSKKKLSFTLFKEISFSNNIKTKELQFNYDRKQYSIRTQYSKDLIDFYKTYPQSDYSVYFSTKNSTVLSNSILQQLAPLLKGKSEIEAVNLLLRFVQTSFKYKTDQKQFHYEKVMFPEETINYPYSDCEDRSILFSYLVKNLLNLDVVGLQYKDHLATAVAFSSKVSGDSFSYKNTRYTISDPTYINANAGMSMPQYKNSTFKIISLR